MKYSLIKYFGNPQTTLFAACWLNAQGQTIQTPMGLDSKAAAESLAARFGAKVVTFTAVEWAQEIESRNQPREY